MAQSVAQDMFRRVDVRNRRGAGNCYNYTGTVSSGKGRLG